MELISEQMPRNASDICFLQETYSTPEAVEDVEKKQ